jgi:hypothetical protein
MCSIRLTGDLKASRKSDVNTAARSGQSSWYSSTLTILLATGSSATSRSSHTSQSVAPSRRSGTLSWERIGLLRI